MAPEETFLFVAAFLIRANASGVAFVINFMAANLCGVVSALVGRFTIDLSGVLAADGRINTIIKVFTVDIIWIGTAHIIDRDAFAMTFLLVTIATESVGRRLANVSVVIGAADVSSVFTAALIVATGHEFIIDTADAWVHVGVPALITFTALFSSAAFNGVWVVVGASGVGGLAVLDLGAEIMAVVLASEFIILAAPVVAHG